MRRLFAALIGVAALSSWSDDTSAGGDIIAIVVNKGNPVDKVGKGELRPIFQTTKTEWPHGEKVVAINLPEANTLRQGVDAAVLGLDPERVSRYWIDRKIRGGAPPPQKVATPGAVLALVGSKPGAIGYVAESDVKGNVKVVARVVNGEVK